MPTRILIPTGAIGLGFDSEAFQHGLSLKPNAICVDGGSTDSGPYYLGTGTSKYSRESTKSEWRKLMEGRAELNVPLIIGSAGTCGTDSTVDWMYDITIELAKELKQSLKVARIYSSQDSKYLTTELAKGKITPLEPKIEITNDSLNKCENIVALAGVEQIGEALKSDADIIIAGRTTDTAIISTLPILNNENIGASWHGAKIGECGAYCSSHPSSGVILIDFDEEGFTVKALAENAQCSPKSVSSHMLYENANPFILFEPGGHLDATKAQYIALNEEEVRVTGSKWISSDKYTVKLEGAKLSGYQSTVLTLLREQKYVENATKWTTQLTNFLNNEILNRMKLMPTDYNIEFRLIGNNATLGNIETKNLQPNEVGVLCIITANNQNLTNEIAKLINPFLLHYPLTDNEPVATFAFPFSPAEWDRGPLYEFVLNHVLELENPMDAFRIQVNEVNCG